jgi:hypothetical protein
MSEQVYLIGAGSLPGIPGVLGPGLYEIDYDARTATPVPYIPATVEATPTPTIDTYTEYYATQPLVDSTSAQTQDQTTTTVQQ